MIKKTLYAAGGVMLVAVLIFGADAMSYLKTSAGMVQSSVRDSIPVEFEIQRAQDMLVDLGSEIRENARRIGEEEVGVRQLNEQIAERENALKKGRTEILRLRDDLARGESTYKYAGKTYTVEQVKHDLSNRFERFKTCESTLESLRDVAAARTKNLEAAREKIEGMKTSRRQLQIEIENLQARMQMLAATQSTSEYAIDDSRLGRIRGLVSRLDTQLEVDEQLASVEADLGGGISLDVPAEENVVNEVTEYFGGGIPSESIAASE